MAKSMFMVSLFLSLGLLTVPVLAGVTKYTFNDVAVNETLVEITASVKDTNKSDYSTCSYFSDDYIEYLGMYSEAVLAGSTAQQVLDFCIMHFYDRRL